MSAVYLVRTIVVPEGDADFNAWQVDEHVDALLALPGYLGVQRFAGVLDPTCYLSVWRLEVPAVFGGPLHAQASHTPWFWRLRPFCNVNVDFGAEATGTADGGGAVTGLVVDRQRPGSAPLDTMYAAQIGAGRGVVRVVVVEPIDDDPAAERRSLPPATVLLSYLSVDADPRTFPAPPAGVERTLYRRLSPYLPAPGAGTTVRPVVGHR